MTKAQKASAASKKVRDRKRKCLLELLAWVKDNTDDKEVLNLVKNLTPGMRVASTVASARTVIADLFTKNPIIHEEEIFANLKLGRTEMRRYRIELIKKVDPANRMWIDFEPDTGKYELKGTGEEPPKDWTGYIPVTVKDMEIIEDEDVKEEKRRRKLSQKNKTEPKEQDGPIAEIDIE